MKRSRRSLVAWLALIVLFFGLTWLAMPWLLGWVMARALVLPGLSGLRVEFASVGWSGASLRIVQARYLGPDGDQADIELRDIDLGFDLARRRLDSVRVREAELAWAQGRQAAGRSDFVLPDWQAVPWSELVLDRLKLSLRLLDLGEWTGQIHAEARLDAAAPRPRIRLDWQAELQAPGQVSSARYRLALAPLQGHLGGQLLLEKGSTAWSLSQATGRLTLPALQLEQGGRALLASGPVVLDLLGYEPATRQARFSLRGDELHWKLPAGLPRISLQASLRLDPHALTADGSLSGSGLARIRLAGRYDLAAACARVSFDSSQALVELDRLLQPRPPALKPLALLGGRANASVELRACQGADQPLSGKGTLRLHAASLGWDKTHAEGIELDLSLDQLLPPRGRLKLGVAQAALAAGLDLAAASLDMDLDASSLQLHEFSGELLGAALHAGPARWPLPLAAGDLTLQLKGLDLERLLKLAAIDGLSGTGRLSGRLPLSWSPLGLELRQGRLDSEQTGLLRYSARSDMPDNPGLQALRNFQYRKLGADLDYEAAGAYHIKLQLDGANPDFYSGHPIVFRLDLNGALPGLFRAALLSGDFDRYLLQQLQQGKLE